MRHIDKVDECVGVFYGFLGFEGGRIFKRFVGKVRSLSGDRVIRVGKRGQSDLYGWVRVGKGVVPIEVEVKLGRDRLGDEQRNWRDLCLRFGVLWYEYRDREGFERFLGGIDKERKIIYNGGKSRNHFLGGKKK